VIARVAVALGALIGSIAHGSNNGPGIDSLGDGNSYYVGVFDDGHSSSNSNASPASSTSNGPPTEYLRAPICVSVSRQDLSPACPNNDPVLEYCIDGSEARYPLWRRTQNPDGTWTDWEFIEDYYCPGDAALIAAIETEWTQLQPQPSDIELQPNTGWVIATVPTVAMAGDAPRLHQATLLGADVEIVATASGYRWEWGDGSHTTTQDPGQPYPNATLTHTYPHAEDAATVALTTTWAGQYRVNGGAWHNFDSTINSASTPVDLVIYDPRSRLVNCDLDGNCRLAALD